MRERERGGGMWREVGDIVPRLHPNYLILPETARNPGYSASSNVAQRSSSFEPILTPPEREEMVQSPLPSFPHPSTTSLSSPV